MDLRTWLNAEDERLKTLAAHLDITPSAIVQWCDNGVPLTRMESVVTFTNGEVSLHEMVIASITAKKRKEAA